MSACLAKEERTREHIESMQLHQLFWSEDLFV
jgi:hypothetical protein